MRKISLIMFCCAFIGVAQAQLPDGSLAPDFSLFEIDKTTGRILTTDTITLYEYTDAGKAVFLDFFANWCGPCWIYHHEVHAFKDLYNQYGPNGTDEVMVMSIEADDGNYANLTSPFNWLAGVPYPIIPTDMSPNTSSVVNDYNIRSFPTILMVCPNRSVYNVGQLTADELYAEIGSMCPACQAGLMNNALIFNGSGIKDFYFCDVEANPVIQLQNVGELDLTSASFTINYDGQTSVYNWTGNLEKFACETITLPAITSNTAGIHSYSITIDSVNGVADADPASNSYVQEFDLQIDGHAEPIDEDFSYDSPLEEWYTANEILFVYDEHLCFNAYNLEPGDKDELYLPLLDLTNIPMPVLKFDVAHARYDNTTKERLMVKVSKNCGAMWKSLYNKIDPALATTDATKDQFIPDESQWRTETVDLSDYKTDQTIVKFVFTSGFGNAVWIDNVKIVDGTGIDGYETNFNIYPNPAVSTLQVQSSDPVEKVEIYNLQGQLVGLENGNVQTVNVGNLSPGIYILRVSTEKGILNHRFVKE